MTFKISIVTATFNAESCVAGLCKSVAKQKNKYIEFIVIDGSSTDRTWQILDEFNEYIDYRISEPDNGIYDAWNKGVQRARGEWIMFLGADDELMPGAVNTYLQVLSKNEDPVNLDLVSSKAQMVDKQGRPIWVNGGPWKWPGFLFKMTISHPGALHARHLFDRFGLYDISYKIVGDYEMLLRPKSTLHTLFVNMVSVKMTEGGMSDSLQALKEHYKAAVKASPKYYRLFIAFWCAYVYFKSRMNKLFRKLGVKLNIDR